jgi:SH3 domain-containing protein
MNRRIVLALTMVALSAPVLAEDLFVKQNSVVIRAGKGSAYEEVTTAKKGDKLELISREGSWLKVKSGGREGYVFQAAVTDAKPAGDLGADLGKMFSGASGGNTASSGEAGKGLGESLDYARSKGMSPAGLDRMIALRKTVTGKDWEAFTAEGKVGPAK